MIQKLIDEISPLDQAVISTHMTIGMKIDMVQKEQGLTDYRICKEAKIQASQLKRIKAGLNYDIVSLLKVLYVLKKNILIS